MAEAGVKERILDTANDLFYQEGVRAVGVDLVVEKSGVAKTSLYRHFATKDDLVAAVLERDNAEFWKRWDRVAARYRDDDAAGQMYAQLRAISQYISGPKYRGCPFLNIATEFPASGHPARKVASRNKAELRRRLALLCAHMRIPRPEVLAEQLVLIIDGAYVNGQLFGKSGPARSLLAAAESLIAATKRTT